MSTKKHLREVRDALAGIGAEVVEVMSGRRSHFKMTVVVGGNRGVLMVSSSPSNAQNAIKEVVRQARMIADGKPLR